MAITKSTETKRVRVQSMVMPPKQRRIKAAAALSGLTMEEWLEQAADEKLARESGEGAAQPQDQIIEMNR